MMLIILGGIIMHYKFVDNDCVIKLNENFNLKTTLECGQCFRFKEEDSGVFLIAAKDMFVKASVEKDELRLINIRREDIGFWLNYFDLDLNYKTVLEKLSDSDETFMKIASQITGIRILNQDIWEALCSFIISQNNNIPRIKGIIQRLCENFGSKIDDNNDIYSFPTAELISKLEESDLDVLRAGFRNRYILDAARKVASGEIELESLKDISLEDARKTLMKIKGVGPKVADCTLLYGVHRLEAFPMDVWMKRAMEKLYLGKDGSIFGKYAGIAQQYIFHYSRMHPEMFNE